jgi:putative addiction module component (TIGR02574 family)
MILASHTNSVSAVEIIDRLRAMAARQVKAKRSLDEFADRDLGLTPKQAAELERRLAEHRTDPDAIASWAEIKAATETKYGR